MKFNGKFCKYKSNRINPSQGLEDGEQGDVKNGEIEEDSSSSRNSRTEDNLIERRETKMISRTNNFHVEHDLTMIDI